MKMFENLGNCDISIEDFSCDLGELPKDNIYIVGWFKGDIVSYTNDSFFINGVQYNTRKFNSLSRAYAYFEELYYKW